MNKWDKRFLKQAKETSTWSKDPTRQVGCVIAKGKKEVSVGYNGFPQKMGDNSRLLNKEEKYLFMLHAEENAIFNATVDLEDTTAYIWPLNPCTLCAARLVQNGITRVVAQQPTDRQAVKYKLDLVTDLFHECKIEFELVNYLD